MIELERFSLLLCGSFERFVGQAEEDKAWKSRVLWPF